MQCLELRKKIGRAETFHPVRRFDLIPAVAPLFYQLHLRKMGSYAGEIELRAHSFPDLQVGAFCHD